MLYVWPNHTPYLEKLTDPNRRGDYIAAITIPVVASCFALVWIFWKKSTKPAAHEESQLEEAPIAVEHPVPRPVASALLPAPVAPRVPRTKASFTEPFRKSLQSISSSGTVNIRYPPGLEPQAIRVSLQLVGTSVLFILVTHFPPEERSRC